MFLTDKIYLNIIINVVVLATAQKQTYKQIKNAIDGLWLTAVPHLDWQNFFPHLDWQNLFPVLSLSFSSSKGCLDAHSQPALGQFCHINLCSCLSQPCHSSIPLIVLKVQAAGSKISTHACIGDLDKRITCQGHVLSCVCECLRFDLATGTGI